MPPARRIRNPVTMDDLARRHQQIQAELAQIGIALPGSLTSRTTRCQRPGCHCHAEPAASCTAPTPPGPARPAPAPSPGPSPPKKPNGSAPTSPPTAACASSSPNSKPSPSNSPGSSGHHRPSRAPNWEISPLSAGSAHRNPAETTSQRVLSVTPPPAQSPGGGLRSRPAVGCWTSHPGQAPGATGLRPSIRRSSRRPGRPPSLSATPKTGTARGWLFRPVPGQHSPSASGSAMPAAYSASEGRTTEPRCASFLYLTAFRDRLNG